MGGEGRGGKEGAREGQREGSIILYFGSHASEIQVTELGHMPGSMEVWVNEAMGEWKPGLAKSLPPSDKKPTNAFPPIFFNEVCQFCCKE